jgi:Ni,Fe-hydrogenase III small subunit
MTLLDAGLVAATAWIALGLAAMAAPRSLRLARVLYPAGAVVKLVVAIGDCGCSGGIFGESYASRGRVSNVIPVDVAVPGCPPQPAAILQGILTAVMSGRRSWTASR